MSEEIASSIKFLEIVGGVAGVVGVWFGWRSDRLLKAIHFRLAAIHTILLQGGGKY
jgi:hypothetical protein